MEKDLAAIYQSELYKTKEIINTLKEMDLNIINYENNIYNIEETLKNNNEETLANGFNAPFIIDYLRINYSEAIKKLKNIQRELSKYEIYIKANSFANMLITTIKNFDDIEEKELDNLIPKAINILNILAANYLNYQLEEEIIEEIYKIIYYLLKEEIKYNRRELYNTLINNTIHTMYLDKEISLELDKLDKKNPKNNKIFNKKYIIELSDINNHYLNYELLSLLVKNNSQEKDMNNLTKLIPLYQKINNKLSCYKRELDNIDEKINVKNITINKYKKTSRYFKNIGTMIVSASIMITLFSSTYRVIKFAVTPIPPKKATITTYNTKNNKETINTLTYEEVYNKIYYIVSEINTEKNNDILEEFLLSIYLIGSIMVAVFYTVLQSIDKETSTWTPGLIRGILNINEDINKLKNYKKDKEILIQDKYEIIIKIKEFIYTYDKELKLLFKYSDFICQYGNNNDSTKLKYYLENINNNINHIKDNESTSKIKKKIIQEK